MHKQSQNQSGVQYHLKKKFEYFILHRQLSVVRFQMTVILLIPFPFFFLQTTFQPFLKLIFVNIIEVCRKIYVYVFINNNPQSYKKEDNKFHKFCAPNLVRVTGQETLTDHNLCGVCKNLTAGFLRWFLPNYSVSWNLCAFAKPL